MAEDRAALDDLAAAVADGADVDWAALIARAETPQDREQIARFALLARIAGVHADAGDEAGAASGGGFAPLPPYAPGDHWGPLRIVELLAAGTFGTVYRAHDPTLARDVALKILHVPASGERLAVDAVPRDVCWRVSGIRTSCRCTAPTSTTAASACGWNSSRAARSRTNSRHAARCPSQDVLAIGADLAQALHAVHAAGLLHRDLKTQNVMRDARDGRVVLMDFSAGRDQVDASAHGAWPATIAGSPLYIAPEVLARRAGIGTDGHVQPRRHPVPAAHRALPRGGSDAGRDRAGASPRHLPLARTRQA